MLTLKKAKEILEGCEVNFEFEAKRKLSLAEATKKPLKRSEMKVTYILFTKWEEDEEDFHNSHFSIFMNFAPFFGELLLVNGSYVKEEELLWTYEEVKEACEKLLPEILELYEERK